VQQLEHGGAFAAGNDQGVYGVEIGGGAHEDGLRAQVRQGAGVRFEIALQG
jgi:hypothetical protein